MRRSASLEIKSTFFRVSIAFLLLSISALWSCLSSSLAWMEPLSRGELAMSPLSGALSPFHLPYTEVQNETHLHFGRNFAVIPQLLYFSLRTSQCGWMAAFHSACSPLKKVFVSVLATSGFLVCAFGLSNFLNLNFKADTLPDPFLLTSVLFMASSLLTFCFN